MKNALSNLVLLGGLMFTFTASQAGVMTFNLSVGGFSDGGTVTGTFTGEDLNNDGYISSFLFKQSGDFVGTGFDETMNEVYTASASFTGSFMTDDGTNVEQVTHFDISNDLTDISDMFLPGFPMDLFFLLNYKLDGGLLGDDEYEGMLFGEADQPFIFGLGPFLPAPAGIVFNAPGMLPGGATLTSQLILEGSNGNPCMGLTCGAVHNVFADQNFMPAVGGSDLTNALAVVTQVPVPPLGFLVAGMMILLCLKRSREMEPQ